MLVMVWMTILLPLLHKFILNIYCLIALQSLPNVYIVHNLMGRNKLMTFNAVVNALFLSLSYHFITSEEAWSGCNPIIPWRLFLINFEIVAHLYNSYGNKCCYKENIQNDKFTKNLKVIHVWISPLWYRFSFRKYFDVGL